MNERLQRFVNLMQEVFELDKSDLDFGIYRIMNIRKAKIEDFLQVRLPKMVQDTLAPFTGDASAAQQRMYEIEKQCADLGIDVSTSPKLTAEYETLKARKAAGTDMSALEIDVYSALYSFFNRYYDEGDFISKRRYKEGVYAIPYEGEEVKLYWANQDQYYIKTSENFKDYTFVQDGVTVHFRLVDATTEQNNNKESDDSKRVFMLLTEDEEAYPGIHTFDFDAEKRELIIRFVFDIPTDKKRKYKEENYEAIKQKIVANYDSLISILLKDISTDPKKPKNVLQKHLDAYVAKNTFDYFIHKDLGGFLYRELDFYIKSEIMHLDDLDTDNEQRANTWLAKVKAIKRVGHIIIDFLAQIENFQKKLWLKKKFVIETNWCMTLDNIDEDFWPEIIVNKAQIAEWIAMYAIDEAEGWTNPPTVDFLRQNQNLEVDTKHFSHMFRNRLVANIDNLDEKTGGLMIHGDNFHALNLLISRYNKKINCIYGDPPYNAKSSEILYKNSYKHSSWIAMMESRLQLVAKMKTERGAIVTAIDENEGFNFIKLIDGLFPDWVKTAVSVLHNPAGVQGDNFSYSHEYAIFLFQNYKHVIGKKEKEEKSSEPFRDWGPTGVRNPQGNTFYPIIVNLEGTEIIGFGESCGSNFHPSTPNIIANQWIEVYPIGDDGVEKKWVFARDTVEDIRDELYPIKANGVVQIFRNKSKGSFKTVWDDKKYYANVYGSKLLNGIIGSKQFDFPKSVYTVADCLYAVNEIQKKHSNVLDYFAGSGTTGHAVINLNRLDGGLRKFILIEMGAYFSTVTKPRIQKVIYSADWKDGKPTTRNTGVSHIMKYIRLESYEDALSNVQLDTAQGDMLSNMFEDSYLVNYMLDTEANDSLLNIEAFRDPFSYQMKLTDNNEAKLRPVDLVETFNYLIGLTVVHQGAIEYYSAQLDEHGSYEGAVRLQRDDGGDFAFQQIEGVLPDGQRVLVIWRAVTDNLLRSNAALDAYFSRNRINPNDREFAVIYVNGDNNLDNIRKDNESWKVVMTETEFKQRMFEEE